MGPYFSTVPQNASSAFETLPTEPSNQLQWVFCSKILQFDVLSKRRVYQRKRCAYTDSVYADSQHNIGLCGTVQL